MISCVICGSEHIDGGGFLVGSNRWQDTLSVIPWDSGLAGRDDLFAVCSPWHVEQLVVHWMTTGSLDYPFAQPTAELTRPADNFSQDNPRARTCRELLVGELAIDRATVASVLHHDPYALKPLLGALLSALKDNSAEAAVDEIAGELCVI